MINNCKAFLSGVIVTLATIIFCNTVFAVATGTNISVFYNNIRIFILILFSFLIQLIKD